MDELDWAEDLLVSNDLDGSEEQLHEFDELVEAADALLTSNGRRPSAVPDAAALSGAMGEFGTHIDTIAEERAEGTEGDTQDLFEEVAHGSTGERLNGASHTFPFTAGSTGIYSTQTPVAHVGKVRLTAAQAKLYGIYDYETNTIKIPKVEERAKASRSKLEALSKPKSAPKSTVKQSSPTKSSRKRRSNEYSDNLHNRPSVADTAVSWPRSVHVYISP